MFKLRSVWNLVGDELQSDRLVGFLTAITCALPWIVLAVVFVKCYKARRFSPHWSAVATLILGISAFIPVPATDFDELGIFIFYGHMLLCYISLIAIAAQRDYLKEVISRD